METIPRVFISYRRADSATFSGRIYDHLTQALGRREVFKDVDDIPPGVDFPSYIGQTLSHSDVLLAIIGPQWLAAAPGEAPRLLDPADFVRVEIASGLRLGLTVIPLLVDGATMPAAEALPEELRPLTRLNALVVRNDPDFRRDMERVLTAVRAGPSRRGGLFGLRRPRAESGASPTSDVSDVSGVSAASERPPRQPGSMPGSMPIPSSASEIQATPKIRQPVAPAHAAPPQPSRGVTVAVAAPPASGPKRARQVALPVAATALVLAVVVVVVFFSAHLPLTGAATSGNPAATRTAAARATQTISAQADATWTALINSARPIKGAYTSPLLACDRVSPVIWVPASADTKPDCVSSQGMGLTGVTSLAGVTATVDDASHLYAVTLAVQDLKGSFILEVHDFFGIEQLKLTQRATTSGSTASWEVDANGSAQGHGSLAPASEFHIAISQSPTAQNATCLINKVQMQKCINLVGPATAIYVEMASDRSGNVSSAYFSDFTFTPGPY